MNNVLLSTVYLGPVEYYTWLINTPVAWIDIFENYTKQTYRNRCIISGANGPVTLVIPVVKGRDSKTQIKDTMISYDTGWQRIHWKTIFSAYGSSPFFRYYDTDIQYFYKQRQWKYLIDFNTDIQEKVLELLGISPVIDKTEAFELTDHPVINVREKINPINKTAGAREDFLPYPYHQVFSDRFGFQPNLSVIDLLFNEGPDSLAILRKGKLASG